MVAQKWSLGGCVGFGDELEKRLSRYAAAAAATGVGLLALTKSAEAKIVYTPANINIPSNGGPIFLDLNNDGTADFSFVNTQTSIGTGSTTANLRVAGKNPSNRILGKGSWRPRFGKTALEFASALAPGATVGSDKPRLQSGPWLLMHFLVFNLGDSRFGTYTNVATAGQWPYTKGRYLGVKFAVNGEAHYGWARVDVPSYSVHTGISATITGYAYETIPNKPIIAGQTKGPDEITAAPLTLGELALGRK